VASVSLPATLGNCDPGELVCNASDRFWLLVTPFTPRSMTHTIRVLTNAAVAVWVLLGASACTELPTPPTAAIAGLPAVPGVEGFGTATPAGRGGRVIRVTSLEDAGPGTLREALGAAGARTIVFEVAGTIALSSNLRVAEPFVTVAGQTAPSPGVTLRGAGLMIQTHDVLVQHLRVRVGDDPAGPAPENRDALQILGPAAYNVVVDHVSMSWAVDEVASTWYPLRAVTISHCIVSEGLSRSTHPEGPHSAGLLIGDRSDSVLVVGSLFAHNNDRNPIAKGGSASVIVNNVIYDPGYRAINLTDPEDGGPLRVSVVGNVMIPGPSTQRGELVSVSHTVKPGSRVFLADNLAPQLLYRSALLGFDPLVGAPPLWPGTLAARPSAEVERLVLERAGARPADRDAVDLRVVREVRERAGRIIDSPADVGGWPAPAPVARVLALPPDPAGDDDGDGYTNLEELLHRLAAEVEGRAP
jgi:hypothetical protein